MDLSAISTLNGITSLNGVSPLHSVNSATGVKDLSSVAGMLTEKADKAQGTLFEAFLNTAIDNIKATNNYLSDAEDEEIKFMLGETENTHDLAIALEKASTALQYTVAIRDKLMDAYKELMQIQI